MHADGQMAFSYTITQALPATLSHFDHAAPPVSTYARILFGKKMYVYSYLLSKFSFGQSGSVSAGVSVLGGVSQKVLLPDVVEKLSVFLQYAPWSAHNLVSDRCSG